MSKLIDEFTEDQKELVDRFKSKYIKNEIDRLTFGNDVIARFLLSTGFDTAKAGKMFSNMLQWRKDNHINVVLEHEANDEIEDDIK